MHEAGRGINLDEILKHELLFVQGALAEMCGNLRTGSKAILLQAIVSGISCSSKSFRCGYAECQSHH